MKEWSWANSVTCKGNLGDSHRGQGTFGTYNFVGTRFFSLFLALSPPASKESGSSSGGGGGKRGLEGSQDGGGRPRRRRRRRLRRRKRDASAHGEKLGPRTRKLHGGCMAKKMRRGTEKIDSCAANRFPRYINLNRSVLFLPCFLFPALLFSFPFFSGLLRGGEEWKRRRRKGKIPLPPPPGDKEKKGASKTPLFPTTLPPLLPGSPAR